jgi:hypothetical protein
VVCHGGAGTTLGAIHMGLIPIVVPRTRRLSEHLEDHQVAFTSRLHASGDVRRSRGATARPARCQQLWYRHPGVGFGLVSEACRVGRMI